MSKREYTLHLTDRHSGEYDCDTIVAGSLEDAECRAEASYMGTRWRIDRVEVSRDTNCVTCCKIKET